ncbi:CheW-like domain protein [compost metagenome]
MHYHEILRQDLMVSEDEVKKMSAIFLKVKDRVLAILVDRIDGQADLVVKPFSKMVKGMQGFKGTSVLADEKICYIVDPEKMLSLLQVNESSEQERSAA